MPDETTVAAVNVERAIVLVRGHRVLLDSDLAALYGVPAKVLNQAVARNLRRFPADFMFQLTTGEAQRLRSQSVTLDAESNGIITEGVPPSSPIVTMHGGRGRHRKYLPYAFTEQGVAMLSSVLRSPRAIDVNIEIMRAFVRLRQMLQGNAELARKLAELEAKYDAKFRAVFDAIRELMTPPATPKKRIGFERE